MPQSSQTVPTLPRLLRVDQVAEILAIDPRTVKRLAADGQLRRVVLGRRSTRYRAADVEALIAYRTADPTTSKSPTPADSTPPAPARLDPPKKLLTTGTAPGTDSPKTNGAGD